MKKKKKNVVTAQNTLSIQIYTDLTNDLSKTEFIIFAQSHRYACIINQHFFCATYSSQKSANFVKLSHHMEIMHVPYSFLL